MESSLSNHKAIDEVNRLKRRLCKYNLYHDSHIIAQAIVQIGSLSVIFVLLGCQRRKKIIIKAL